MSQRSISCVQRQRPPGPPLPFPRAVRYLPLALGLALVAGCGGGGGGAADPPVVRLTPEECKVTPGARYIVNFLTDGTPPSDSGLQMVGDSYASSRIADIGNLKPSCASHVAYRLASGTLPPGLQLDAQTGRVSGQLREPGFYRYAVEFTIDGASLPEMEAGGAGLRVADPSQFTLKGWNAKPTPFPNDTDIRIDRIGDQLLVTGPREPTLVPAGPLKTAMATWRSADLGSTWTDLGVAGPTPETVLFGTAHDGSAVYLVGGQAADQASTNHVWKFDGARWSQRTAAAPFAKRWAPAVAKVGGNLYVAGGNQAFSRLTDFWVSSDEGATWRELASPLRAGPGTHFVCAANFRDSLVLVQETTVWQQAAGGAWTQATPLANSPLLATQGRPRCAALGGRLYVAFDNYVISSSDLARWQFEPTAGVPHVESRLSPGSGAGIAVIGNRLYLDDAGPSGRLYESIP